MVKLVQGFVKAAMSSEFTQNIAPHNDGSTAPPETTQDASEPVPITEQEVGEYREQDRFLPVSILIFPRLAHPTLLLFPLADTSLERLRM